MKPAAHVLIAATAVAVFLLNPSFGCSGGEDDSGSYEYGREDMEAAVLGTWRVTLPDGDATLALETAPGPAAVENANSFLKVAYACGDRTFYKAAHACVATSTLSLRGQLSGSGGRSNVEGHFLVYGRVWTQGNLDLSMGDDRRLSGDYLGQNLDEFDGTLWSKGGAALGRVRFTRVK